jgi:hypothetical protein
MEKMTNLDEKIYVACYGIPSYGSKIAELIYGVKKFSDVPQLHREIIKLEKNGWIRKATKKEIEHPGFLDTLNKSLKYQSKEISFKKPDDERSLRRHYYIAESSKLFNIINDKLKQQNKELNQVEKEDLKQFLERNCRTYFYFHLSILSKKHFNDIIPGGIELILDYIGYLCAINDVVEKQKIFLQEIINRNSPKIKDDVIWKKEVNKLLNDFDKWKEILPTKKKAQMQNTFFLEESLMEKLTYVSNNTIFMKRYMTSVARAIIDEMLLLNEYRQEKKKPVLTHSLAFPDFDKIGDRYITNIKLE